MERRGVRRQRPAVCRKFSHHGAARTQRLAQLPIRRSITLHQDTALVEIHARHRLQDHLGGERRSCADVDAHVSRIQLADRFRSSHDDERGLSSLSNSALDPSESVI